MGYNQIEHLEALDFMDTIGPIIRVYTVCRARTGFDPAKGTACSCGLA